MIPAEKMTTTMTNATRKRPVPLVRLVPVILAFCSNVLFALASANSFADVSGQSSAYSSLAGDASSSAVILKFQTSVEIDSSRAGENGSPSQVMLTDLLTADSLSALKASGGQLDSTDSTPLSETQLYRALSRLKVSDLPLPGENRVFTEEALAQMIRGSLSGISPKPVFRLPTRILVRRKSLQLDESAVKKELISQLKSVCSDCEYEITNLSLPLLAKSTPNQFSWSVKLGSEIPRGSFSIPLVLNFADIGERNDAVDANGEERRSARFSKVNKNYWLTGRLSVFKKAAVAARAIASGEKIQPEDFSVLLKDVTFASDAPASTAEIGASVAARQISAGEVVWRSHLRREAAVHIGDTVKVMAGADGWQISIDGVAQGMGSIGDSIRVKIPRTQKIVSGLLKEKGLVEVQ